MSSGTRLVGAALAAVGAGCAPAQVHPLEQWYRWDSAERFPRTYSAWLFEYGDIADFEAARCPMYSDYRKIGEMSFNAPVNGQEDGIYDFGTRVGADVIVVVKEYTHTEERESARVVYGAVQTTVSDSAGDEVASLSGAVPVGVVTETTKVDRADYTVYFLRSPGEHEDEEDTGVGSAADDDAPWWVENVGDRCTGEGEAPAEQEEGSPCRPLDRRHWWLENRYRVKLVRLGGRVCGVIAEVADFVFDEPGANQQYYRVGEDGAWGEGDVKFCFGEATRRGYYLSLDKTPRVCTVEYSPGRIDLDCGSVKRSVRAVPDDAPPLCASDEGS